MSRSVKSGGTSKMRRNVVAAFTALTLIFMQAPVSWAVAGANPDAAISGLQSTTEVDQGAVREVGVSFDHAYIVYGEQVLAAPATKMTIPDGADFVFQVEADKGYEVSSVKLKSGTDVKRLEAEADGSYRVRASALAKDSVIEVAATATATSAVTIDAVDDAAAPETQAEPAVAPSEEAAPQLTVQATDSSTDLADFLLDAAINAAKNANGEYVILPGTSYSISLSFGETPSLQFPNDGSTMTYHLPEGLHVADGDSGQLTIKVNDGGVFYDIPGNTCRIDDGVLYFDFNTEHENFPKLAASANARFGITFTGSFTEGAQGITFKDGISKSFEVDNSNSVSVSKDASFDKANNVVNYTVSVYSKGLSRNVVVKDTITGDVLTLDASSIRATSSLGTPVAMEGSANGNSFQYTIPEMKNGELVTFTYTATVDPSKIAVDNGKYVATTGNSAEVKSDGDPDPDTATTTTTIDYTPTIAKSNAVTVAENGNLKTMRWTLTANADARVSMAGDSITDTIADDSKDFTKYSGTGIKVDVFDANGTQVRADEVAWAQLAAKSDSSWTYTIPASDSGKAYKYVITYETESDLTGKTSITTVSNGVATGGGQTSSGGGQGVPVGGEVKVHKSVDKVDLDNREISWTISFNVPEAGLDTAVVTDTYPAKWFNGKKLVELIKEGSIQVTGLRADEAFNVDYGKYAATITFYKDAAKTSEGLQAGAERTVTITLKTEITDAMLAAGLENSYYQFHVNDCSLNANGEVKTARAQAVVIEPTVTKKAKLAGTRTVNGVELPIYRYEIILSNVTSDVNVIDDVYDTSLLEPIAYSSWDAFRVFAGDVYSQTGKGGKFSYVFTPYGMRFTTSADAMLHSPKNPSGFYDKYKLVYYLTVRDEAALNTLIANASAAEDGKYAIGNTATWNGHSDEAEVDYEYQGLKKELLTPDADLKKTDEDIWADFRITLNPGAQTLNGGQPLVMTDTFNNLSIDYESITATPSEGVSWDVSGNVATYTIPDNTKVVISYKARVIVKDNGQPGDTVNVNFSNVAEMKGYKDGVSATAQRHNSGSGAASVPAIKLMKYEAGDMTHKLEGAKFALLDENKNPVVGKDGPVTFTTDASGMISVRGDQEQLGWALSENTRYYLREVTAPSGYMLASFDYSFQVSDDGTTDYDNYIYHSGDVLSAKNYAGTDAKVVKVWSDGNNRHGNDSVTVKLQQKAGEGDWSDAVRMQVKNDSGQYEWQDVSNMTATLSSDSGWAHTFTGLPLAAPTSLSDPDADDVAVSYRVVETAVNGKAPEEGTVQIVESEDGGSRLFTVMNKVDENINVTGSATFKATKVLNGRTLKSGEFEFVLEENGKELQRVTNMGDGVTFAPIVYHATESDLGEHTYTIREVQPEAGTDTKGVTYDSNVYTVKVMVIDDGGEELSVTYADGYNVNEGVVFSNSYATEGEATLLVKKIVSGMDMVAGKYEFELTGAGLEQPVVVRNDANGDAAFPTIHFWEKGTYNYQIREKHPAGAEQVEGGWLYEGITYDDRVINVSVVVEDNGDGTMTATPTYSNGSDRAEFSNSYEASGTFLLAANKKISGRQFKPGDTMTFEVTAPEGTPMPEKSRVTITPESGNTAAVDFGAIAFGMADKGKTYEYTVREVETANMDGVAADATQHTVRVTVNDKLDGTFEYNADYSDGEGMTFVNRYEAEGEAKLFALKTMEGRAMEDGEFSFVLKGDKIADRYRVPMKLQADGTGVAEFPAIKFSAADAGKDFKYEITEVNGGKGGVAYDAHTEEVTIHVIDNGDGTLSFTYNGNAEYAGAPFSNQYRTVPTDLTLGLEKVLAGGELEDGQFSFTLSGTSGNTQGVSQVKSNDADGKVAFDKIVYDTPGTYEYTITENVPEGAIDNQDGTYRLGTIVYNGEEHTVVVTVEDDGQGNLSAKAVYDGDAKKLVVTNGIQLPKAGFEFTKYCFGATGDFKFKLTAADKDGKARPGTAKEFGIDDEVVDNGTDAFAITVSNGAFANGTAKVVFPEIGFSEDGDYYYMVEEAASDTPGVMADEASYLVHVKAANGNVVETTYELIYDGQSYGQTNDLSFYNNSAVKLGFASISAQSYTEYAQKTSAYPQVKKYLNGSTERLVGGDFEFELVDAQTGAVVARATNDETGKVAFFDEKSEDGLVFTEAGTYHYLIREVAGNDRNVIYDESVITLTVNVTDTGEGLQAELAYGGAVAAGEEPAFYNTVEGMDLTVQKVSRYGGEGLVDCTYALWMVGDNGDVMIQEAVSDASGFITFEDVNLMPGVRYYFKEVEAPAGHTVDPYRTAYFSLNEDGTDLVLVEETAADGWHSKYDNIELDKARKASEVSE